MAEVDWSLQRDLIRTLVKRVEIDHDSINVVFRVAPSPSDPGPSDPDGKRTWQDCGWSDEPAARQHLPPLRLRSLGRALAVTPRDRRHDRRALRRRPDRRLRAPAGCGAVPRRSPGAAGPVGLRSHPEKTRLIEFGKGAIA